MISNVCYKIYTLYILVGKTWVENSHDYKWNTYCIYAIVAIF